MILVSTAQRLTDPVPIMGRSDANDAGFRALFGQGRFLIHIS